MPYACQGLRSKTSSRLNALDLDGLGEELAAVERSSPGQKPSNPPSASTRLICRPMMHGYVSGLQLLLVAHRSANAFGAVQASSINLLTL